MSDYDEIYEISNPGIYYGSEDGRDEIESRKVGNNHQKIFFREVARCPRLNSKDESEIGKKLKKQKERK